jgi:hypothetical protein
MYKQQTTWLVRGMEMVTIVSRHCLKHKTAQRLVTHNEELQWISMIQTVSAVHSLLVGFYLYSFTADKNPDIRSWSDFTCHSERRQEIIFFYLHLVK